MTVLVILHPEPPLVGAAPPPCAPPLFAVDDEMRDVVELAKHVPGFPDGAPP